MKQNYVWYTVAAIAVLGLMFYRHYPTTIGQNDSAAIGKLRQLSESQAAFAQHSENRFACSLAELSAKDEYSGYRFLLQCDTGTNGDKPKYQLIAQPLEFGRTGLRTYCVTEQRLIWYDERGSAVDCFRTHKLASR